MMRLLTEVNALEIDGAVYVLIDSGAAIHCCPRDFAENLSRAVTSLRHYDIRSAGGGVLGHHGSREISFKALDSIENTWHSLRATFEVSGVKRPILSVSRLREKGFTVVFGKQAYIENRQQQRLGLIEMKGFFFLKVQPQWPRRQEILMPVSVAPPTGPWRQAGGVWRDGHGDPRGRGVRRGG